MVVFKKLKICGEGCNDPDTRQRIMDAAVQLFALKGFEGTSVREIAKLAKANVASLNYHFKSKENLRAEVMENVVSEFKKKITDIDETNSTADYAIKVFETITADSAKCLNQFKLVLDSEHHPCESDPYKSSYSKFSLCLSNELKDSVPETERIFLINVVFSYVIHVAVISSTRIGKKVANENLPQQMDSFPIFIRKLVEGLIRDLNNRF